MTTSGQSQPKFLPDKVVRYAINSEQFLTLMRNFSLSVRTDTRLPLAFRAPPDLGNFTFTVPSAAVFGVQENRDFCSRQVTISVGIDAIEV